MTYTLFAEPFGVAEPFGTAEPLGRAADLTRLADRYAGQGWVLLPKLLSSAVVAVGVTDLVNAQSTRVAHRHRDRMEWRTEHKLDPNSRLAAILCSPELLLVARSVTRKNLAVPSVCWAQTYDTGERTSWHTDDGDAQFVFCLQSNAAGGGELMLRTCGRLEIFKLNAGDALLFSASTIPHATTRIRTSKAVKPVPRISATVRYFANREAVA